MVSSRYEVCRLLIRNLPRMYSTHSSIVLYKNLQSCTLKRRRVLISTVWFHYYCLQQLVQLMHWAIRQRQLLFFKLSCSVLSKAILNATLLVQFHFVVGTWRYPLFYRFRYHDKAVRKTNFLASFYFEFASFR